MVFVNYLLMPALLTSHPVHVGRHVAGVLLSGPESEIGVLVVTVALVVFGRHRHEEGRRRRSVVLRPPMPKSPLPGGKSPPGENEH